MSPGTVPGALVLPCRHESAPDVNVAATVVRVFGEALDRWQAVQSHPSPREQAVSYEAEIPGTDSTNSLPRRASDGHVDPPLRALEQGMPLGGVQGQGVVLGLAQNLGAAGAFSEGRKCCRGTASQLLRGLGQALCMPTISDHPDNLLDPIPSVLCHCCLLSPGPHGLWRGWPRQPPDCLSLEHSCSPSIQPQSRPTARV